MISTSRERGELRRWAMSGVVVLLLHAAAVVAFVARPEPIEAGESSDTVIVDLAPIGNASIDTPDEDATPGPKQEQMEATPPQPEKVEQTPDEKVDVPPAPVPPVAALPQPEPVKPDEQTPVPPAPAVTAPPRERAVSQAAITSWHTRIVAQIERSKAYPRAAQERGERGVVRLQFRIDRDGRVMSSQVVKSSGYPVLDQETIETVHRAQPFPPPPADLKGETFDFSVPVSFNIR